MDDDPVRRQYEAYPYPRRDPAEEAKRLITGSPSNLVELNHYLFAGRRDFSRPFRALVAGGGTGDAAIMLAQQLADAGGPGEVVYLDLSAAARQVAEARARVRGLANVTFLTGSILDLPDLGLGRFDYVDCCGVLHHLDDPPAGLAALAAMVAEDGGLGVMVYGVYGRTGVYPAQAMLRQLGEALPLKERVAQARRLLAALPPSNWLKLNELVADHERSDAELVDLLLHPQDRAYSVPQVVDLARGAGLEPVAFLDPALYEPATYLKDPALLSALEPLDWLERAAFAERLAGVMKTHRCYLAKGPGAANRIARPEGPHTVPVAPQMSGPALAKALGKTLTLKIDLAGTKLRLPVPRLGPAILSRVDGKTSLGEIHQALAAADPTLDWPRFQARFDQLYQPLNGLGFLLIANQAISSAK
jgi:SAM-dependent methyltransferase